MDIESVDAIYFAKKKINRKAIEVKSILSVCKATVKVSRMKNALSAKAENTTAPKWLNKAVIPGEEKEKRKVEEKPAEELKSVER